jgi:hypothetical protein
MDSFDHPRAVIFVTIPHLISFVSCDKVKSASRLPEIRARTSALIISPRKVERLAHDLVCFMALRTRFDFAADQRVAFDGRRGCFGCRFELADAADKVHLLRRYLAYAGGFGPGIELI